jgi:hypothetical protein
MKMYGGMELQLHILYSPRYPLDNRMSNPNAGLYDVVDGKIYL